MITKLEHDIDMLLMYLEANEKKVILDEDQIELVIEALEYYKEEYTI